MDPEKLVEMQRQMRQNNDDLQSFLKDMDSWESDIKKKDDNLKKKQSGEKQDLPPVRNSLEQKRKKKKKKEPKEKAKETEKPTKKRISAYDFRSWDKFDVDAACEEVDQQEPSSDSEYETDEEWETERKKLLAVQHKDQGNQLFKEGKFTEAIEQYTKAIEFDCSNAVLPANRAMALIKQEKYAAAELDCTRALALDEAYLKAYHRRGTARAALHKYAEAKHDFQRVLKQDAKNRQARQELEKIERLLNPPKVIETKSIEATSDYGLVKAIYKPLDKRSKKPLRRIAIEEIGEDEEAEKRKQQMSSAQAQQSETKQRITAKDNQQFDLLLSADKQSSKSPATFTNGDSLIQQSNKESKRIEIIEDAESSIKEDIPESEMNGESLRLNIKDSDQEPAQSGQKPVHVSSAPSSSPSTSPRVPAPPSSSFQFQADWKVLKNTEEQFYQYFKQIKPSLLPKLFGQSLDSDVLVKIFTTLKNFYLPNGEDVYEPLRHLCDVSRFSMTVMFMSSNEKKVLKEVFEHLVKSSSRTKQDIDQLKAKYQL